MTLGRFPLEPALIFASKRAHFAPKTREGINLLKLGPHSHTVLAENADMRMSAMVQQPQIATTQ